MEVFCDSYNFPPFFVGNHLYFFTDWIVHPEHICTRLINDISASIRLVIRREIPAVNYFNAQSFKIARISTGHGHPDLAGFVVFCLFWNHGMRTISAIQPVTRCTDF